MAAVCIDTIFLKLLLATVVSTSSSPEFNWDFLLFKLLGSWVIVTVGTIIGEIIGGGGGDALGGDVEEEDSDDDISFSPLILLSPEFFLLSFCPPNT